MRARSESCGGTPDAPEARAPPRAPGDTETTAAAPPDAPTGVFNMPNLSMKRKPANGS